MSSCRNRPPHWLVCKDKREPVFKAPSSAGCLNEVEVKHRRDRAREKFEFAQRCFAKKCAERAQREDQRRKIRVWWQAMLESKGRSYAAGKKREVKRFHRIEIMRHMHLARAAARKLHDTVRDIHYKTANFLCANFTDILLPRLDTSAMVRRTGVLAKQTRVGLQVLRHSTFWHRLRDVAQRYPDVEVRAATEWGTSKLCGGCLKRTDVGPSEKYVCSRCPFTAHRDGNSARMVTLVNTLPMTTTTRKEGTGVKST
jgi:transposase